MGTSCSGSARAADTSPSSTNRRMSAGVYGSVTLGVTEGYWAARGCCSPGPRGAELPAGPPPAPSYTCAAPRHPTAAAPGAWRCDALGRGGVGCADRINHGLCRITDWEFDRAARETTRRLRSFAVHSWIGLGLTGRAGDTLPPEYLPTRSLRRFEWNSAEDSGWHKTGRVIKDVACIADDISANKDGIKFTEAT